MGEIEWAIWANEQAVVSAFLLLVGGIIGVAGSFRNWEFAAVSILISLIVFFVEWPRSKRKKGKTIERCFQNYIAPIIAKSGFIGRNYFIRFVAQILLGVPACFLLPTILGGLCLFISAFIYLAAAIKGEEWSPTCDTYKAAPTPVAPTSKPPSRPPPRNPVRKGVSNSAMEAEDQ